LIVASKAWLLESAPGGFQLRAIPGELASSGIGAQAGSLEALDAWSRGTEARLRIA